MDAEKFEVFTLKESHIIVSALALWVNQPRVEDAMANIHAMPQYPRGSDKAVEKFFAQMVEDAKEARAERDAREQIARMLLIKLAIATKCEDADLDAVLGGVLSREAGEDCEVGDAFAQFIESLMSRADGSPDEESEG